MGKLFVKTFLFAICSAYSLSISSSESSNENKKSKKAKLDIPEGLPNLPNANNFHPAEVFEEEQDSSVGGPEQDYIKLQANEFPSKVTAFTWWGKKNETIFALTITGNMFSSIDYGVTWKSYNYRFETDYNKLKKGPKLRIIAQLQNEYRLDSMIFTSEEGISWSTNDCGENITLIDQGNKFMGFKFHPKEKNLIIGLKREE